MLVSAYPFSAKSSIVEESMASIFCSLFAFCMILCQYSHIYIKLGGCLTKTIYYTLPNIWTDDQPNGVSNGCEKRQSNYCRWRPGRTRHSFAFSKEWLFCDSLRKNTNNWRESRMQKNRRLPARFRIPFSTESRQRAG